MGLNYRIKRHFLMVLFCVVAIFAAHAQTLDLRQQFYSTSVVGTPFYWLFDGGGRAIDYDGTQLIYGAPYGAYQPPNGYFGGAIFILEKASTGWTEVTKFTAPGFTNLGMDVAIDGDWAFAGAPYYGKLYIYKKTNGTWAEYQVIDKSNTDHWYGFDISYSNGRLAVSMNGSAFIYENVNGQWVETAHFLPPAGGSGAFGSSVSLENDNLVISDSQAATSATTRGRVNFYQFINNAWTIQQQIDCPTLGQNYGSGIEISGNTLAISEIGADPNGVSDAGQVYMYSLNANTWTFDEILQPLTPVNNYHFGGRNCISIDGSTMVIGHFGNGPDRAHVYKKENGHWVLYPDMTNLPNTDLWFYGGGVFVSGDEYFVGAESLTDPNAAPNMNKLGGVLYWTPSASISNISTTTPECTGGDITFDVNFDVENPLGDIEVYDSDNDVVLASGLTAPITVTLPAVTAPTTLHLTIRLAMDNAVSANTTIDLYPCSCEIQETILWGQCNNNNTPDDGTDDTFLIHFSATNSDPAATQYTVLAQGVTYGPYDYGTGDMITGLPSDFSDIPIVFTDVDNPTCTTTRIIHNPPCSGCNNMPIHITGNSPVCEGGYIDLTEDGGYSSQWLWSGPNNYSYNSYHAIIPATLDAAGTYSVTITTLNGCTAEASYDVVVNSSVTSVDAGTYGTVCNLSLIHI